MEWTEGRKLARITYNNQDTTYEYNHEGLRTKKTLSDGSYILYDIVDGVYVGETRYNASGSVAVYIRYILDEGNSPVGISLWYPATGGWTDYHFVKNLQGDVLEVYKVSDGSLAASYTYDSWGNILSQSGSLASINPFRYRSYYYDTETWFYYLQSRYYDPAIGRFLNADALVSTGQGIIGNNMFAYCNNNPVTYADSEGKLPSSIINPNAMALDSGCSLRPIPDKERQDTYTELGNQIGTLFIGRTITASYGAGGSVTIGVAVDRYWNVGLIVTPSAGGGFPAIGTARVWGVTNAPTIYDLSGWSGQVGGSINACGGSVGIETSFFANPQNGESYQGWAFMLGAKASLPVEVHGTIGYTFVFGGNLFDILINSSKAISFQ